jgi:hypothetical protein
MLTFVIHFYSEGEIVTTVLQEYLHAFLFALRVKLAKYLLRSKKVSNKSYREKCNTFNRRYSFTVTLKFIDVIAQKLGYVHSLLLYGLGNQEIVIGFLSGVSDFSLLSNVQTGPGAHPATCPKVTLPGRGADH